jgi:hypothetical protein
MKNQANMLDAIIKKMNLKNDAALANESGIQAPTISRIRSERDIAGPTVLIHLHEYSDIPIKELKALMS